MTKLTNFIKPYVFITIGLFIFAFGWTAFLIPSEIVGGGISGIGSLIYFSTGFPVGYTIFLINVVLVIIAMRILGARFGINTIYGIVLSSLLISFGSPMRLQYDMLSSYQSTFTVTVCSPATAIQAVATSTTSFACMPETVL